MVTGHAFIEVSLIILMNMNAKANAMAGIQASENAGDVINTQVGLVNLSNFIVTRVLRNNAQRKVIFLEGRFKDREGKAVLIFEKPSFDEENVVSLTSHCQLTVDVVNDVYGKYECFPDVKYNGIKTTLIFPATDKHIQKYEAQPVHIIEETRELYETVTFPHISQDQFTVQWVYNILEHKSEVDRIVFEDEDPEVGFVLLPDLKWDGKKKDDLYLLAIVRPRGIRSLRDLTDKHLPLLFNVRDKATKSIKEKYDLDTSQLRVFFHYQPSFYHLHIHFTYLSYEAPGIYAEHAHLLSTVINNIHLKNDYYQAASLPFTVNEASTLFLCYEKKGLVKRAPSQSDNDAKTSD